MAPVSATSRNPDFVLPYALSPQSIQALRTHRPDTWLELLSRADAFPDAAYARVHYTRMYHASKAYWTLINGVWYRNDQNKEK